MPALFSIEDANRLIPVLEGMIRKAVESKREVDAFRDTASSVATQAHGNGHADHGMLQEREQAAEKATEDLRRLMEDMQALGCEIKDLDRGLVDFPHEREGRVVYLCWVLGEPEIAFWHEIEAGFAGRQPL